MRTSIRQWHAYIGLFIGPSVLFFALTGAAQIFGLHEAHGGYKPLALVEKLSSVHKDQVFALGDHHPEPAAGADKPGASPPPAAADEDDKTAPATLALKVLFLIVAMGLSVSTVLGLWMGLTQTRRKPLAWLLLVAGTLTPVVLLLI